MNIEPVVAVYADGKVIIGRGYDIGQILDALAAGRQAVLSVVLRAENESPPGLPNRPDPAEADGF